MFTVLDYYDGPRQGVANFRGTAHFFDCIWDESRENFSNRFRLTPIPHHIFALALEDWAIWERWQQGLHATETTLKSHPDLTEDRKRRDEIQEILGPALRTNYAACITQIGSFEPITIPVVLMGVLVDTQVRWTDEAAPLPTPSGNR